MGGVTGVSLVTYSEDELEGAAAALDPSPSAHGLAVSCGGAYWPCSIASSGEVRETRRDLRGDLCVCVGGGVCGRGKERSAQYILYRLGLLSFQHTPESNIMTTAACFAQPCDFYRAALVCRHGLRTEKWREKEKCAWEFLDPMKFIIQFNINQNSKTGGDSARTIDFFWPTCSFGALSPSGMSVANGAAEPKNVNHQPQKQKKQNKTIQDKKRQQRVEVTNGM